MNPEVPDHVGFAIERAWRVWHASRGVGLISLSETSGRNAQEKAAPTVFLPNDFLVLPDFLVLGASVAHELKSRSYAPYLRVAKCTTTGMLPRRGGASGEWYRKNYLRFAHAHKVDVHVYFAHLCENEIRGGPMSEIEAARTQRVNVTRGAWFYEWELLPRWPKDNPLSLAGMLKQAMDAKNLDHRAAQYFTTRDYESVKAYYVQSVNWKKKHDAEWRQARSLATPEGGQSP